MSARAVPVAMHYRRSAGHAPGTGVRLSRLWLHAGWAGVLAQKREALVTAHEICLFIKFWSLLANKLITDAVLKKVQTTV